MKGYLKFALLKLVDSITEKGGFAVIGFCGFGLINLSGYGFV